MIICLDMTNKKVLDNIKPLKIQLIEQKEELKKNKLKVSKWLIFLLIILFITLFFELIYILMG